jgi:hypothetical protein
MRRLVRPGSVLVLVLLLAGYVRGQSVEVTASLGMARVCLDEPGALASARGSGTGS